MTLQETTRQTEKQWNEVTESLHSRFEHEGLRPGQEEIIRSVLGGKNTLAIMPTGAGKSLCYQLPALHLPGTTIVVSPLISLMKDQREKVSGKGISAVELNSSLKSAVIQENLEKVSEADAEIIYVTPERFTNQEFLKTMSSQKIDFVVIDEAHCVSQWGHDFRPAYLAIGESLKVLKNPAVLALTATATPEVAEDIQKQLGLKDMEVFRSSVYRENLKFEGYVLATPKDKMDQLLALVRELKNESGIVYTSTVKAATEIHEFLEENGIASELYHGKMKAAEREESQNEFMNNSPRLMIATNAFGMGIDKPDIRFVIHFQFPSSLEAYYQEAGRAGRDGEPARCILFYLKRDKSTQSLFLAGKYPTAEEVGNVYEALKVSSSVIETPEFEKSVPKKKLAVILSMLKQANVVKVAAKSGLKVLRENLSPGQIAQLAEVYVEREVRDKTKLNRMIVYAQTALCRWHNILNYFGEEAAEECGHCDNCMRASRRVS